MATEFMTDEAMLRLVGDGSNDTERDTIQPPPKPVPEMFHGLIGEVAHAAAEGTEVNPVGAATVCLSYLSACAGRSVYFAVGNTWHRANLFTIHIGRTGRGGKGDALGLVSRIREQLEKVHSGDAPGYHGGGLSTREGLVMLVHDGYSQGKEEILPIDDKRLWVVEREFANVLHQARRDGNTLSACLRDCWDGQTIKPATKSARVWATDPHIAIHANITPSELLELMEARELSNGFANRFLMVWSEGIGSVPFPALTPTETVNALAERLVEVIRFAKGNYPADKGSRQMGMTPSARAIYEKAYRGLRKPLGNELLTAVLERRAPYVLRLAMLFALADLTLLISEEHLKAALAWVRYATDTVRFVFAERAGMEVARRTEQNAEKLLGWLQERPDGASLTEISVECFQRHASSDDIGAAIRHLLTTSPPAIEQMTREGTDRRSGRQPVFYRSTVNNANSAKKGVTAGFLDCSQHCEKCEQLDEDGATPLDCSQSSHCSQTAEEPGSEPLFANFAFFAKGDNRSATVEVEL